MATRKLGKVGIPPTIIPLLPGDRIEAARIETLLNHFRSELDHYEQVLRALVTRYGVNLESEDWELDTATGVLTRVPVQP